jgi:hypothetical protein
MSESKLNSALAALRLLRTVLVENQTRDTDAAKQTTKRRTNNFVYATGAWCRVFKAWLKQAKSTNQSVNDRSSYISPVSYAMSAC